MNSLAWSSLPQEMQLAVLDAFPPPRPQRLLQDMQVRTRLRRPRNVQREFAFA